MLRSGSGRGKQSGVSLLEMAVVVILIAILVVVATARLLELRVAAERAAVERTLITLRTVIVLELARRMIHNEPVGDMEGANPMLYWDRHVEYPLPRYRGQWVEGVEEGGWYYESAARLLVFRSAFAEAFRSNGPDASAARFRVALVHGEQPGVDSNMQSVRLEPLDAYGWSEKELAEMLKR
jgi:prepilin-type N-terminal cleavage/methylation domain-containing protein